MITSFELQKGGENLKKCLSIILLMTIILISISSVNAYDNDTNLQINPEETLCLDETNDDMLAKAPVDLESKINNAKNNAKITINPGAYQLNNIKLT